MHDNDFFVLLSRKKQTIFAISFIFLILATVFTLTQTFKYRAESRLLIVQTFAPGTDPYAVAKANEYLSNVLANVTSSNLFFNLVMESDFGIDKNYFNIAPEKQMKLWKKTVKAQAQNDSGIIAVTVYHSEKTQAEQILLAIDEVVKNKHTSFHGWGDKVEIKVINQPIISQYPVKPNIPANIGIGVVLGVVFSLFYIVLFPDDRYSLGFSGKKKIYIPMAQPIPYMQNVAPTSYQPAQPVAHSANAPLPSVEQHIHQNMPQANISTQHNNHGDLDDIGSGSMRNIFG